VKRRIRPVPLAVVAVLAAAFGWALAPEAAAYVGQNPYAVHLSGPGGTVSCSRDVTITATVKAASNGRPVAHQTIIWDFRKSLSSGDRLSPRATATNGSGQASVTLSFGPVAGSRQVRASVAQFPATLVVSCSGPTAPRPTPRPTPRPQPAPHPTQHPTSHPTHKPAPQTHPQSQGGGHLPPSDTAGGVVLASVAPAGNATAPDLPLFGGVGLILVAFVLAWRRLARA
jgi:hypothetical protein